MFLVALAYLAFFSIALPDSTLGVIWPSMRLSFDQPTSAAGLVPPVGVAAGLISTSLSGYIVVRLGVGRLLAAGTLYPPPLSASPRPAQRSGSSCSACSCSGCLRERWTRR